jgi:hypothetical protein
MTAMDRCAKACGKIMRRHTVNNLKKSLINRHQATAY